MQPPRCVVRWSGEPWLQRGPAGDVSHTSAHMAPKLLSSPEVPEHVLHFYVNRAAREAFPFVGAGCTDPSFREGPVSWR